MVVLCITIKLSSTPFVKMLQAATVMVISDWREVIVASNRDILNRSLISYVFDNTPVFKTNHRKVSVCTVFLGESTCKLRDFSSRPSSSCDVPGCMIFHVKSVVMSIVLT